VRAPLLALAVLLAAAAPCAADQHRRLVTAQGPVHVWTPDGFDPRRGGVAVYVHGYGTTADRTWEEEGLLEQFRASHRNALFVVPEAPAGRQEAVSWPSLGALLEAVWAEGVPRPRGPLVAIGHSAAYRTLVPWLRSPSLREVVLLDAVYGYGESVRPFRSWILGRPQRRLLLVVSETVQRAEQLVRGLRVVRRSAVPEDEAALSRGDRQARVVYYRSQYGHMEIVREGRVIPLLLALTRLPGLPEPGPAAAAAPRPPATGPHGR
jgi:hypothetical protein